MENDSKSFIFGYVFEFIVVASVPANQRLSYHCARFHFYGNRAICVEAFKSILIMSICIYISFRNYHVALIIVKKYPILYSNYE